MFWDRLFRFVRLTVFAVSVFFALTSPLVYLGMAPLIDWMIVARLLAYPAGPILALAVGICVASRKLWKAGHTISAPVLVLASIPACTRAALETLG